MTLLVAVNYLEAEVERLAQAVSRGYVRGQLVKEPPTDLTSTDHLIALNAEHLRRILVKYAAYGKDAPRSRLIEPIGDVVAHAILGGLHHRCARI